MLSLVLINTIGLCCRWLRYQHSLGGEDVKVCAGVGLLNFSRLGEPFGDATGVTGSSSGSSMNAGCSIAEATTEEATLPLVPRCAAGPRAWMALIASNHVW